MTRAVYRCPKCGGVDVSARAWVNPNFMPKRPSEVNWLDEPDVICDDCCEDVHGWNGPFTLEFDENGLVVTDDGRHITLEEWAEENPVERDDE